MAWGDFIDEFIDYVKPSGNPELFRTWGGIALVGGALERRVFMRTRKGPVFPNMYILLVAPPGVGKYIIEECKELWRDTIDPDTKLPAFRVAPDNMSKAALIDSLAKAKQTKMIKGGEIITYHSLLVPAEEFSILVPAYDSEYINTLTGIWNNKRDHKEERRHGPAREVNIEYPQLNILGGVQPAYLANVFAADENWLTGMNRRTIMVYSGMSPLESLFWGDQPSEEKRKSLVKKLGTLANVYGQMKITEEAMSRLDAWHLAGGPPTPSHSKLEAYNRTRTVFVIKLATIARMSRDPTDYVIELEDIDRAIIWLTDAETTMPDIFRAMVGKSDVQVLEELHLAVHTKYFKDGKKAVPESFIWAFLKDRVTSDKIERLINTATKAGLLEYNQMGSYKPLPKPDNGRSY